MIDHCAVKGCRGAIDLIYLGKPICLKHWDNLCENKKKLRSALGLKPLSTFAPNVELSQEVESKFDSISTIGQGVSIVVGEPKSLEKEIGGGHDRVQNQNARSIPGSKNKVPGMRRLCRRRNSGI